MCVHYIPSFSTTFPVFSQRPSWPAGKIRCQLDPPWAGLDPGGGGGQPSCTQVEPETWQTKNEQADCKHSAEFLRHTPQKTSTLSSFFESLGSAQLCQVGPTSFQRTPCGGGGGRDGLGLTGKIGCWCWLAGPLSQEQVPLVLRIPHRVPRPGPPEAPPRGEGPCLPVCWQFVPATSEAFGAIGAMACQGLPNCPEAGTPRFATAKFLWPTFQRKHIGMETRRAFHPSTLHCFRNIRHIEILEKKYGSER